MNEATLTTLYCIIDDFINTLEKTSGGQKMLESWKPKRGPQRQLALSEVLTLNIMRFDFHIFDLKAFTRLAHNAYKPHFPRLPNYENILKEPLNKSQHHGTIGRLNANKHSAI